MKKRGKVLLKSLALGTLAASFVFAGGCGKEESKATIAVIFKDNTGAYWGVVGAGAEDAGEELNLTITTDGPANETLVQDQIAMVNSAVEKKVDAIVLAATDIDALNDALARADSAGIPVLTIDTDVTYEGRKSFIGTNSVNGGSIAARQVAPLLEGGNLKEIAIIGHVEGSQTAIDRIDGFVQGMESMASNGQAQQEAATEPATEITTLEDGTEVVVGTTVQTSQSNQANGFNIVDIKYCEGSADIAKEQTLQLLDQYPNIGLFYGTNETSTIGICQAIDERGLSGQVKVIGFDANDTSLSYIRNGTLAGIIVQNPYNMGYLGVRYAKKLIEGETIPARIDTGCTFVNADNINDDSIQLILNPVVD